MGRHASGPAPDPNDELREIFRVEPLDARSRRDGWGACAVAAGAGVAAWALDVFTRGPLGAWRYLLVVPLGVYTVYLAFFCSIFLAVELASKATARDAPRWLRLVGRYLGTGASGLAFGLTVLAAIALTYPQPRPWWFYAAYAGAACALGVLSGTLRRRRRRARWTGRP